MKMRYKIIILLLYLGIAFINAALAVEEVEYNIIVPDYIDLEKNLTIDNVLLYTDVTGAHDAAPWGLDWGEIHAPYKWKVITEKEEITIGFERYEIISAEPLIITFYRTVTEQIGSHTETRYHDLRQPQPTAIMGISAYSGIQATSWWNSAWQYRIDSQIPEGARPYQLSLTISNSAGTNNGTHVFLNGSAKNDLSDIRFTLDNAIELPYWIENITTGKVWIRVPDNGTVNMYYGNPSATDSSDGTSTFEFFEDFKALDLGANPVISPDQGWEAGGYLRWGTIAYSNGIYYIYYTSGSSASSDIGRAKSTDLITWTKNANNPVINDRIGPSLLKELDGKTPVFYNNRYWMLTMKSDGSSIELRSASTLDNDTWNIENSNLIPKVPGTWYANYLYTTSFTRENGNYYIVMESGSPGVSWKIGYFKASSPVGPYVDGGVLLSPTLSWEGIGVLDPEMRKFDNSYYLFYTGNDAAPYYQNSYATNISNLGGKYTKSDIKLTTAGQTYPAILQKDLFYYILTDDQPSKNPGKSLFRRKDLNGPFGSPFEWNKNGTPTVSGSELLINENGEFLRSSSNFLYKAMKIRAKNAPQTPAVNNKYQYFGFVASSAADETPSEMYFGSEGDLNTFSGNSTNAKNTRIYSPDFFGSYHNYEILWRKGEAKFIVDDMLKTTHTTSVADASLPLGIYDYTTAANLTIDWVFVRNYVAPEPEWADWSTHNSQTGVPFITGLPQESQVSDVAGAIRTFSITANQEVNVTWYLNSVIVKDIEKSVTQATYTITSASLGVWNVSAVAKNANGNTMQTWTWTVSSTTIFPGISFIDPTPLNGATLNQNYVTINTTILDFNTAFIDWNRSLAGWWRFNSEAGENSAFFRDWSSWGNNGTCSGTSCPISTSGKFGNALSFDGSNDYITLPNSATLNPSYITVETWFNAVPRSLSYQKSLVQKAYTSHANPYYQYMLSLIDKTTSPKQATFYVTVNGVLHEVYATNLNYGYEQWHYLAGTYDGSNIVLYLDGAPVATKAVSGTINSYNSVIQLGSYPNLGKSSNYVFNGKIDEMRIHTRALSPQEIKASYNAGIFRLYNNFTNLAGGNYNYRAYAQGLDGNVNQTQARTLILTS